MPASQHYHNYWELRGRVPASVEQTKTIKAYISYIQVDFIMWIATKICGSYSLCFTYSFRPLGFFIPSKFRPRPYPCTFEIWRTDTATDSELQQFLIDSDPDGSPIFTGRGRGRGRRELHTMSKKGKFTSVATDAIPKSVCDKKKLQTRIREQASAVTCPVNARL
jgi:hypothetical protein